MSFAFDRADDSPTRTGSRTRQPGGPSWLHSFTATFAGALLAGVVLLLGVRLYIHWSISDTVNKVKESQKAK